MSTRKLRTVTVSIVAISSLLMLVASAQAATIEAFSAGIAEPAAQRAGAHADLDTTFSFATEEASVPHGAGPFEPCATATGACQTVEGGAAKDISVELPPGFVGSVAGIPQCSFFQLREANCPAASQVGVARIGLILFGMPEPPGRIGLFNMVPERGAVAQFGYKVIIPTGVITARLRPSDQVLIAASENTSTGWPLYFSSLTFWGVPGAAVHDPDRACSGNNLNFECEHAGFGIPRPFLANAATCGLQPPFRLKVDTYQRPGAFEERASEPQALTGCESESFRPGITVRPTASTASSPSGLDVALTIPQNWESPNAVATPPLKDAVVTLPQGITISPSQVTGLGACSNAQVAVGTDHPVACPDSSKIAAAELTTPLLPEKLTGAVFLGNQLSNDPESGEMYRQFLVLENEERGLLIKLPGQLKVDANTGQVTSIFNETPQLPFSDLKLRYKSGPRAPLSTPVACGKYTTQAELTSWATGMPPVKLNSSFEITSGPNGSPCPAVGGNPLKPKLNAGTTNPVGGAYSPFVLQLQREDGQQEFGTITTTMPEGLLGKLAGIPYCPDSALAAAAGRSGAAELGAPSCPAASQVGTVTVGSGPGTMPFYLNTGKAYLAGPYKGAPLSLAFVTPVVAGPFDLGDTVVRSALNVDPKSLQISVSSDPLPHILGGVPLQIRDLRINIDRNQFTLNPTSCDPMAVDATVTGMGGSSANLSNRFQVGSCGALGFKPKLKLQLKGATKRSGHPALKAVVTYPKEGSYANIARAQVGLPHSEFLDQGNLNKVCKQADLTAGTCPASSIYGRAKAWTPLLDHPLEGPVYLGVGFGYKLPALVADLNGQIRVLLVGRIDTTKRKGIRSTFQVVPDAPVSRFVLEMKGGKKYGLLENSENTCRKKQRASALFTAHNGDRLHLLPRIAVKCGGKQHKASGK